jgi:hypothetical protein
MSQPLEEEFQAKRYLVITPFTIMAVAPHATKLGVGVLKWERSLLSLKHLDSQPLFRDTPHGGPSGAGGGGASSRRLRIGSTPGSGSSSSTMRSMFFGKPKSDAGGANGASSATSAGVGAGAGRSSGTTTPTDKPGKRSTGILSALKHFVVGDDEGSAQHSAGGGGDPEREEEPYAYGLLASFAPETHDTATLLRMFRAGKRPVQREGWLLKRKRTAWRERAPLGPLAWKRRYFVLAADRLTYYTLPPGQRGSTCKGVIPLTGWVEVARTAASMDGPDALAFGGSAAGSEGVNASASASTTSSSSASASAASDATTRARSFIVRTGKSYHVFQAASEGEVGVWLDAISTNAQHMGAGQDEPQCICLPTFGQAVELARVIKRRRGNLIRAMGSGRSHEEEAALLGENEQLLRRQPSDSVTSAAGGSGGGGAGGMSVAEAIGLAQAMGGITDEFLSQLHPDLAAAVRAQCEANVGVPAPAPAPAPVAMASPAMVAIPMAAPVMLQPVPMPMPVPVMMAPASPHPLSPRDVARAASLGGGAWYYLDQYDRPQGPYSSEQMRAWLLANYFGPNTLARSAVPVSEAVRRACTAEVGGSEEASGNEDGRTASATSGLDAEGVPHYFLPLSALFSHPTTAFASHEWMERYVTAARYQGLAATALQLGLDHSLVNTTIQRMERSGLPADLSILLDMCADAPQQTPVSA